MTVTDVNGCTAEGEFSIFTTGIAEVPTLEAFDLAPNPTTGMFYVTLTFTESVDYQVVIYNVLGQQLYFSEESAQSQQLPINLAAYPSGTYYVQLKTEKGQLVKPLVLIE